VCSSKPLAAPPLQISKQIGMLATGMLGGSPPGMLPFSVLDYDVDIYRPLACGVGVVGDKGSQPCCSLQPETAGRSVIEGRTASSCQQAREVGRC